MAVISTSGVVSQFVTSALMGLGGTAQDPNGRFYLDGSMVGVELSRVIAEAIYIQDIFRDGQSVTGKYTTGQGKAGAVRVMLETPLDFSSRTTEFGGRQGTDGNGGVINVNPAELPASEEFMVYLNQVNDQILAFPELQKEYLYIDVMAKRIASYAQRVSMDRSASTLAEILAYSIYRALNGGNNLINDINFGNEGAYGDLVNRANSALDNGDITTGAFTFPTEGRTIIGRPTFINGVMSLKSGLIVKGGEMAQEMLKSYNLDARFNDRNFVGTGYKGYGGGFHWQSAPDYIWSLAEKYLGLAPGALSHINAIVVSYDATAAATNVDLGVKVVDATMFRGSLAQPLNLWGHESFRISYIVGDAQLTTSALTTMGFSAAARKHPVAPSKTANLDNSVLVPVYDGDGAVVGYKPLATVPTPNGDNIKSGVRPATT